MRTTSNKCLHTKRPIIKEIVILSKLYTFLFESVIRYRSYTCQLAETQYIDEKYMHMYADTHINDV